MRILHQIVTRFRRFRKGNSLSEVTYREASAGARDAQFFSIDSLTLRLLALHDSSLLVNNVPVLVDALPDRASPCAPDSLL